MTGISGQIHQRQIRRDGLGAEYQGQAEPGQIYSGVSDPMLRGYRGDRAKAGLITIAFLGAVALVAAIILTGLSKDAHDQRQADYQSREYAAYTQDQVRKDCLALSGKDKANCFAQKRHEYRKDRREERDLVAQRKSANWTFIMGAAAVVGMALSVVGVVLIWITFAETRKANQIAWQGQRAWLHIEAIEARQYADVLVNKLQILTNITLTIRNSGNSPAISVDREAAAFSMDRFRDDEQTAFFESCRDSRHYVVENIAPGAAAEVSFLVARGDVIDPQPESASETLTIISVAIGYEVGGSSLRHQTCQSYLVGESILPEGGINAFRIEDLAIPRITAGKPMGRVGALHPYQGAVMT